MTKQAAKALSIEVWQYLADHPECGDKCLLPNDLFQKIAYIFQACPLCDVLGDCIECPLGVYPYSKCGGGLYASWKYAHDAGTRQQAAQNILDIIKAWEVAE